MNSINSDLFFKNESIAMAADNVEMMIETMAIINKTFFFKIISLERKKINGY